MRRIVFSDLDETIVRRNKAGVDKSLDMLYKVQESGHYIVICTERNKQDAYSLMKQYEIPYDYLITNNGSQIIDNTGHQLFGVTIPFDIGIRVLEHFQYLRDCYVYFYDSERDIECGIQNGITLLHDGYTFVPISNNFIKEAEKSEAFDMIGISPCYPNFKFSKMVGITYDAKIISHNYVTVALNESAALYITPGGLSKENSIERLEELLQENIEVYSIGE